MSKKYFAKTPTVENLATAITGALDSGKIPHSIEIGNKIASLNDLDDYDKRLMEFLVYVKNKEGLCKVMDALAVTQITFAEYLFMQSLATKFAGDINEIRVNFEEFLNRFKVSCLKNLEANSYEKI